MKERKAAPAAAEEADAELAEALLRVAAALVDVEADVALLLAEDSEAAVVLPAEVGPVVSVGAAVPLAEAVPVDSVGAVEAGGVSKLFWGRHLVSLVLQQIVHIIGKESTQASQFSMLANFISCL